MIESVIALLGNFLLPYLVLSLLAMLIVEVIAGTLELRGRLLRDFVRRMLGDPAGTGLAGDFYGHHLVASLSLGTRLPSYIPAGLFAIVVADVMRQRGAAGAASAAAPEKPVHDAVRTMIERPRDVATVSAVRRWYDDVMDGASGEYRMRTLRLVALVALAIVVAVDFDAIRISNHVAQRALIEKSIDVQLDAATKQDAPASAAALAAARASVDSIRGFPIGWQGDTIADRNHATIPEWLVMKVVGLVTSMLAITLGAPFVFDLLNRFMVVRSTVKPWIDSEMPHVPDTAAPAAVE